MICLVADTQHYKTAISTYFCYVTNRDKSVSHALQCRIDRLLSSCSILTDRILQSTHKSLPPKKNRPSEAHLISHPSQMRKKKALRLGMMLSACPSLISSSTRPSSTFCKVTGHTRILSFLD